MTDRRTHSAEFKRDAVQLAQTSGNLSGTARDLGVNASLLRRPDPAPEREVDH
ncbi:transposase-like protein [Deinococcus budaensis]|uniref:Transposase-like protein n=1 Tax=Deinococcus budaensis TaxID=1665626 RepID=A0A7W8LQ09_9DEIO|nr:transposase-like protein [Deinococcus budaensis]